MKSCRRLFSLFLVFVLSVVVFSTTANAESKNTDNIKANIWAFSNDFGSFAQIDLFTNSVNGTTNTLGKTNKDVKISKNTNDFNYRMIFTNVEGNYLIEKNKDANFHVSNLAFGVGVGTNAAYESSYLDGFNFLSYTLIYEDGTESITYYDNAALDYNNTKKNFTLDIEIPAQEKNVIRICVYVQDIFTFANSYVGYTHNISMFYGTNGGSLVVSLDQPSEESGFLSGILGWVTKIADDVKYGFANMVQGITELPQKLWNLISEGLKSLFVPDEEYMSGLGDKWNSLLSSRFGAIYEVSSIIIDFVGNIQVSDATNSIYMPPVSLENVGIPFSFGGYDIQVVPDGFDIIVEILKKIISIVCTFMFINGLRKRYDEVMGVEQ